MFCFNALKSSSLFNQIILINVEKHGFSGLTPALLNIFAFLAENDNMSVSTLAAALGVTRQAMHKSINKLAAMNYVTLETRPANKKEKIVAVTGEGERLIELSLKVIRETEEKMAELMGRDAYREYLVQQQRLTGFLEEIRRGE